MEKQEETKEKSLYEQVISGEVEPKGVQKGWKNLEKRVPFNQMTPEKRKEICRKGQKALMQLHGEKKSARQSLEKILTIKVDDELLETADVPNELIKKLRRDNPNATIYDLIQLVAVGKALGGSMKGYELIRDTHGDKPIDRVEVTDNITTEADRDLMKQIAQRLEKAESVQIVEDITGDGVKTETE